MFDFLLLSFFHSFSLSRSLLILLEFKLLIEHILYVETAAAAAVVSVGVVVVQANHLGGEFCSSIREKLEQTIYFIKQIYKPFISFAAS